jgi:hypothetical protein
MPQSRRGQLANGMSSNRRPTPWGKVMLMEWGRGRELLQPGDITNHIIKERNLSRTKLAQFGVISSRRQRWV